MRLYFISYSVTNFYSGNVYHFNDYVRMMMISRSEIERVRRELTASRASVIGKSCPAVITFFHEVLE